MGRALLAVTLAFSLAAPSVHAAAPAPANESEGAGEDEVLLKNGGMVRGTVVAVEPESHVEILVGGTGESRTIPWAEVLEVQRGKHEPMPAPGEAVEPEPGPGKPRIHLDIRGGKKMALAEVTAHVYAGGPGGSMSGISFRPVCTSPCDEVIDGSAGQEFFLSGHRISTSRRFTLAEQSGDLTIKVRPGNAILGWFGWFSTSLGVVGTVTGTTLLVLSRNHDSLKQPGIITLSVGIPLLVGGIAMIIGSRTWLKLQRK